LVEIRPDAPQAVPVLIEALGDKDRLVRMWAANVLARIGPEAKAAIPALLPLLKEENSMNRGAADAALRSIGLPPEQIHRPWGEH